MKTMMMFQNLEWYLEQKLEHVIIRVKYMTLRPGLPGLSLKMINPQHAFAASLYSQ